MRRALAQADMVVLSGGTSKGAGDLSHTIVSQLGPPGIVVHGVALKPGKPLCLAVVGDKPIVVLPGFPTSAIFTFHAFVAPVIRARAGLPPEAAETLTARVPVRVASELGPQGIPAGVAGQRRGGDRRLSDRQGLRRGDQLLAGRRLSSRSTRSPSALDAGSEAEVTLIGSAAHAPDLVIMGSHDVALDVVVGALAERGFSARMLAVGSLGGVAAASRGECDVAPVHLIDPASGQVQCASGDARPGAGAGLAAHAGHPVPPRRQTLRGQERRAKRCKPRSPMPAALMVNRNAGSGTRVLIDKLLDGARPPGYANQPKSHNAVAAAIAQERADWGLAIEPVARLYGLGFLPVAPEHYDFLVVEKRRERPAVQAFLAALHDEACVRASARSV